MVHALADKEHEIGLINSDVAIHFQNHLRELDLRIVKHLKHDLPVLMLLPLDNLPNKTKERLKKCFEEPETKKSVIDASRKQYEGYLKV